MSKCGKGCMPECEYFMTGGCISPFNCMYKEESGYINSATSGTVIYTGGMNMTNEEMIENLKCVIADITAQCKQLEAENTELKAQLNKRTINNEFVMSLRIKDGQTYYIISRRENRTVTHYICTELTLEAAEARLKELQGGEE